RADALAAPQDALLQDARLYRDAGEMLAAEASCLDGVMIGTRCRLHTEMACKVAPYGLPIFLEKPVAITFEQLRRLEVAFRGYRAPVVVSFPLRLSPMVQRVRELIAADAIGTVEHVVAVNDVPYGSVYYHSWYRDYTEAGGLFLQKATHDLDYIHYLLGQRPRTIAAMKAQRVYGGDKPFDLRCADCGEYETCPESPFNLFYERFDGEQVVDMPERMCLFAEGIRNQDLGNVLIDYEGGAQASYTQNFFARHGAARRGARLYGYKGTIDCDWYRNTVQVYKHQAPVTETIDFSGNMPHFGGDRELCLDFLRAMRDGTPSRSPLAAGILSALTCLWARESAETQRFCAVQMPD
ncbi:MAG TPA: Gfo/Idh/MocA family oxidoreductase, partial [Anaerolineae bacterium]|nr:Gfo/Idh/MocA family oxidoreductase [Anaerolineae bacterium]